MKDVRMKKSSLNLRMKCHYRMRRTNRCMERVSKSRLISSNQKACAIRTDLVLGLTRKRQSDDLVEFQVWGIRFEFKQGQIVA